MLKDEPFVAKFLFDTSENELSGVEHLMISSFGDFDEQVMSKVISNIG